MALQELLVTETQVGIGQEQVDAIHRRPRIQKVMHTELNAAVHIRKYPIEGAAYNCEARAGSLDPALIVAELACFPLLRTGIDP